MKKLLVVDKPIGLTPLQVIIKLKTAKPEFAKEKIAYAGRLDPMAHGVMLLLIGEETKNREKYFTLPKKYIFEIALGLETDTYDLLGLLPNSNIKPIPNNVNIIVNTFVHSKIGKQSQRYPPFSSKTVQGKPLFWWTKNNKLATIEIPQRAIEIYEFSLLSSSSITKHQLEQRIKTTIAHIKGDFRQEKILHRWETFFAQQQPNRLQTVKLHITCSSGTYVRALTHELGEQLGCGAVTVDIFRTKVGKYSLDDANLHSLL